MSLVRYLGYLRLYQHPPTISCGGAKMESEKQWEMDEETQRNGLGEGSNRTESNNQLRNTRKKEKRELIFQRDVPKNNIHRPPPKPIQYIDWEREVDDAGKYAVVGTCVASASTDEEEVLAHGTDGRSLPHKKEKLLHQI